MAVAKRLGGGLDDMVRGLEVGLADAEVDNVLALILQRLYPRQHLERRFRSQP